MRKGVTLESKVIGTIVFPALLKNLCLHHVVMSNYGKYNENADLLANSHNILHRWKDYIFQLLNVHMLSDIRQIEIHIAEPLVPEPSLFEVEIAIAKFKNYKSPGSDQIQAELIQAGGETRRSDIHKLINPIWSKEEFVEQWKKSTIISVYRP
jgi:hypothetical protein